MTRQYLNFLKLHKPLEGENRRIEMINEIMENGTFLPKTLLYEDIDNSFKEWVEKLDIVGDDGKLFPTMTLYSNQRFSEYSQSWKFVDENQNLRLNFKTITRDNNPQAGKIQNGLWNIPGDRFYTIKNQVVLDDNGSESLLKLKMKQPTAVDLNYKISIFTSKFASINEFNMLMNRLFSSCQAYISPNGHYMPMKLENISDTSQYNIDDRQFYSQTYQVKVMAYIITEDDYRVEEHPIKVSLSMNTTARKNNIKADVEIEEFESDGENQPVKLTVLFSPSVVVAKFNIDIDFIVENIEIESIKSFEFFMNDEPLGNIIPFKLNKDSDVKIAVKKKYNGYPAKMIIHGINPSVNNDVEIDDEIVSE